LIKRGIIAKIKFVPIRGRAARNESIISRAGILWRVKSSRVRETAILFSHKQKKIRPVIAFLTCLLTVSLHFHALGAPQENPASNPGQSILLKYRFKQGETRNYENTINYKIYYQKALLMDLNATQQYSQKILNRYDDGSADIAFTDFMADLGKILSTGDQARNNLEQSSGGSLNLDPSGKIKATLTITPLGKIMVKKMISPAPGQEKPPPNAAGNPTLTSGSGLERLADGIPPEVRHLLPVLKKLFTGLDDLLLSLYNLDDDQINFLFSYTSLPAEAIRRGDVWTNVSSYTFDSFTPVIDVVTNCTFVLKSIENINAREIARILINGTYEGLGQEVSYKDLSALFFSGIITGEEKIDNTRGILLDLTSHMEGDIILESTLGTFPIRTEMEYSLHYLD